jgi:hypothetical protein
MFGYHFLNYFEYKREDKSEEFKISEKEYEKNLKITFDEINDL